jgi:hypothetical protein
MIALVTLLAATLATAAPPEFEQCLGGEIAVTHNAKTYRLASEACREQFLSDPERFAQLYDALQELAAAGEKPRVASLVPS